MFLLFFVGISLIILSFGYVNIVNREMKKCQYSLIIKKANGDVAANR